MLFYTSFDQIRIIYAKTKNITNVSITSKLSKEVGITLKKLNVYIKLYNQNQYSNRLLHNK